MSLPVLDRDLYFVHDIVVITNNSGMRAWVAYHIDDHGWIDDAARAFQAIGHPDVAAALNTVRAIHLEKQGKLTLDDNHVPSLTVWDYEDQIYRNLYNHLIRNEFVFRADG